jgi:serine phosphatase RsbU (regulator of sigma subunit)
LAILKGRDERRLTRYVPEYVEELAHEERIKQELQIAREVQQSFLPVRMPKIQGLDIAAFCRPAYETGGDYFDFIQLDEHRVALAIGDVSGKGIQAAFYMTFTKGILHSLCRETDSPAELLIKANRLFCDNARKGTFISLVYGIIDLQRRTFTFARAGHNPVIRMNAKLGEVEELQPVGLGLGLTKDAPFSDNIREIRLDLCADDVLVLYTDGIVEALNEAREFYGNKRLVSLLKRHKKHSSSEILNAIFENVSTFVGKAKQHDDMTTMVIRLRDSKV